MNTFIIAQLLVVLSIATISPAAILKDILNSINKGTNQATLDTSTLVNSANGVTNQAALATNTIAEVTDVGDVANPDEVAGALLTGVLIPPVADITSVLAGSANPTGGAGQVATSAEVLNGALGQGGAVVGVAGNKDQTNVGADLGGNILGGLGQGWIAPTLNLGRNGLGLGLGGSGGLLGVSSSGQTGVVVGPKGVNVGSTGLKLGLF